jgi:hypothetical protein
VFQVTSKCLHLPSNSNLVPLSETRSAMKAIQIAAFGNPAEVVKVVDIPDVGAPAAGLIARAPETHLPARRGISEALPTRLSFP